MRDGRDLRLAIWCAVSSKGQVDRVSLDEQERLGRELAAALDAHVVRVYVVPGQSRDLIFWQDAERDIDAYRQLRQDVQASAFDLLWALDVDRLGRDPALSNQVLSLVERQGSAEIYLHTAPHVIGAKTAGHRYLPAIQSVRAAEDQDRRVYHHRMGIKGRIKRGLLGGTPPHGYDIVRDDGGDVVGYRLQPGAAAALRLMTDLFLAGHSYNEIRGRLDASPYPAPRGDFWSYSVVHKALHSDTYAGIPSWGPFTGDDPSPHIEALWDPDTFAAVVRERQRRNTRGYIRTGAGPLTGVATCGRCGCAMSRTVTRGKYPYLRCSRHSARSTGRPPCHPNYIPERRVLDALTTHLQALADPATLDRALQQLTPTADRRRLAAEIDRARALVEDLDHQRRRLGLALAAGKMAPDIYHATDTQLLEQQETQKARLLEYSRALDHLPDMEQMRQALSELAHAFPALVQQAEPAEIAKLLQSAGVSILIEDNQIASITP